MAEPAATGLLLLALSAPGAAPAPWTFAGLPQQAMPATRFAVEPVGPAGAAQAGLALRVEAQASYGNLLYTLPAEQGALAAGRLRWTWRVDQPLAAPDLRRKAGDDAALKVCAMFDMPLDRVPFVERQLLRLAASRLGQAIPAATLCWVWDPSLPRETLLPNAHSRRLRFITLGGKPGQWESEERDLASDFQRAFGEESAELPPLRALAIGADADNTAGHSIGWVRQLQWLPPR